MSKIKKRSEKRSPSHLSLESVQNASIEMGPDGTDLQSWYDAYSRNHDERLAFDLDYVKEFIPHTHSILECGSVPPILTRALQTSGYTVTGLDISPQRFHESISKAGLDIRKTDIETEKFPFPDDSFDCIIFNEIFEHLRIDLLHTMGEVMRILKPGGRLLLSTPNLRSVDGILNLLIYNKSLGNVYIAYAKRRLLGHMGHVRVYTSREIGVFLSHLGFRAETVIYRGRYHRVKNWKQKFRVKFMNAVARIAPPLRPFFSIVFVNPDHKGGCEFDLSRVKNLWAKPD